MEGNISFYEDVPRVVFYSVFSPFFIIGIFGNSLLIFIIVKHRKMWTVPNRYLLNASLADLLFILSSAVGPYLDNREFTYTPVCVSVQVIRNTCMTSSVYTLTVLSVERYHAVAYPLRQGSRMSATQSSTVAFVGSWIFSLGFSLGKIFMVTKTKCSRNGLSLDPGDFADTFTMFSFIFTYAIPLVVIAVFYTFIGLKLFSSKQQPSTDSFQRPQLKKKKMTWVVLALIVTFAISFLPYYVMVLLVYFKVVKVLSCGGLVNMFFYFTNIYACTNPLILYGLSEPCRKLFNHYLSFKLFNTIRSPPTLPLERSHTCRTS